MVARAGPSLVEPTGPAIVAVRFSAPAGGVAVVLSTWATRLSVSVMGAEMVLLPVPTAAGTLMVAGPAPASSKVMEPEVPVVMELVKALAASLLNTIEPTVWAASAVMVRLAVWAGL